MNNYGPRVVVNIAAGIAMATIWLVVFPGPPVVWTEGAKNQAIALWACSVLYLLSYRYPTLRWALSLPYLANLLVWTANRSSASRQALRIELFSSLLHHATALPLLLPAGVVTAASWTGDVMAVADADQWRASTARAYIPAFLLCAPMLIVSVRSHIWRNQWFRETFRFGSGQSAEWAIRNEYHEYHLRLPRPWFGRLGWIDRFYLGKTRFRHDVAPRHVGQKTNVHLVTLGMSGSGKSATSQWINYALLAAAMLIVDIKGEHAAVTTRRRRQLGPVYHLAPFGQNTSRYNPLAEVDVTTEDGLGRIEAICGALVLDEANTSHGSHFSDNAKTILEGFSTLTSASAPSDLRNMVTVYRMVNSQNLRTGQVDPDLFDQYVVEMSQCPYGQCAAAAKLLLDAGPNERGSFLTTLSKSVRWMASPQMQHLLSGHDFSMRCLAASGRQRPTIYCLPGMGREKAMMRFVRLTLAMGVIDLRSEYVRTGRRPDPGCVISIDEYPLFAKGLDQVSTGFGTLREVGGTLWVQAQKKSQIDDALGEKQASLLWQNSTLQVFGVTNDVNDTARWVSEMLGDHVVTRRWGIGLFAKVLSRTIERLMTPRAVQDALPQEGRGELIFPVGGCPPMWLNRCQHAPFLKGNRQLWEPLELGPIFDPPNTVI